MKVLCWSVKCVPGTTCCMQVQFVYGINFSENYSLVVHDITFWILFLMVIHLRYCTKIINVKTAFLYGEIKKKIYMECSENQCLLRQMVDASADWLRRRLVVGMFLYLVKYSHPDLINAIRESSKANDGANPRACKELLQMMKYVLDNEVGFKN